MIEKLRQRFVLFEFPLLFIFLFLHPKYAKFDIALVEHNVFTLFDVIRFVRCYGHRLFTKGAYPTAASVEWMTPEASTTWCIHAHACHRHPYKFWWVVYRNRSISPSVRSLASVAMRLFCITPNAAHPECIFSEFGRLVTLTRMQLNLSTIKRTALIAAVLRHRTNTNGTSSSSSRRKQFKKVFDIIHVVLESDSACTEIPMQSFNANNKFDVTDLDEEGVAFLAEQYYVLYIAGLDSALIVECSSVCHQHTAPDDNHDYNRLKNYGFNAPGSLPYEDEKRTPVDTLESFGRCTVYLAALFQIDIIDRLPSPLTGYKFN